MVPVDVTARPLLDEDGVERRLYAKEQQHLYRTLPALAYDDANGTVVTEWSLNDQERERIAQGENIRLTIWTFKQKLQPVKLEVTSDEDRL